MILDRKGKIEFVTYRYPYLILNILIGKRYYKCVISWNNKEVTIEFRGNTRKYKVYSDGFLTYTYLSVEALLFKEGYDVLYERKIRHIDI